MQTLLAVFVTQKAEKLSTKHYVIDRYTYIHNKEKNKEKNRASRI